MLAAQRQQHPPVAAAPVIVNAKGKRRTTHAARQRFDLAMARSGLTRVTPHALRHTIVTWLQEAGVPLPVIQAIIGHATAVQTLPYGRVTEAPRRHAATVLGPNLMADEGPRRWHRPAALRRRRAAS